MFWVQLPVQEIDFCNEYQPKGGDALQLGSKGRYGLYVGRVADKTV